MSPQLARPPRGVSRLVFIGSHLGYPMEVTPLGGGAMVGVQLARSWSRRPDIALTVLGSGPESPVPGLDYHRVTVPAGELVSLSELGYARFCREFERAATAALESRRRELGPEETCVVVNDISEGPDLDRVAAMGYPILTIWHVDVVDFFNRMYAHGLLPPEALTRAYDRAASWGLGRALPDVLRLIFDKQRRAVLRSGRMVVPSTRMAGTIRRCYERTTPVNGKIRVIPWGGWDKSPQLARPPRGDSRSGGISEAHLRSHYQISPDTRVLLTLSRISPEKGLHLLIEALRQVEARVPWDICLFICGEPAFMRGRGYERRVRAAAEGLRRTRVFFPGYFSEREKQAYFRMTDLFVSPSIHESYGLSLVEALRAGLPVLASDHAGGEDIVAPAFGRVVPYNGEAGGWLGLRGRRGGIPGRLAAALEGLLADREGLKVMGRSAAEAGARMAFDRAAEAVGDEAIKLIEARCPQKDVKSATGPTCKS